MTLQTDLRSIAAAAFDAQQRRLAERVPVPEALQDVRDEVEAIEAELASLSPSQADALPLSCVAEIAELPALEAALRTTEPTGCFVGVERLVRSSLVPLRKAVQDKNRG